MTRPRPSALVIAAVLAIAGAAAIVAGQRDRPVAEPPLSPPPAAPASASAARTGDDVLTRGRLLPTSSPTRVRIPALRVDQAVTGLGLNPYGSMQVPTDAHTVGW